MMISVMSTVPLSALPNLTVEVVVAMFTWSEWSPPLQYKWTFLKELSSLHIVFVSPGNWQPVSQSVSQSVVSVAILEM